MRKYFIEMIATLAAAATVLYALVIRPWHLRWGATAEEVAAKLPGDDRVAQPFLNATRAVTVAAPPAAIWPWLLQMGYRRGGWYSYDWLDNDRVPSAARVVPELQHLQVGDLMLTDAQHGFTVVEMEPNLHLVLFIDEALGQISSAIVLDPAEADRTRLIVRLRARFRPSLRGLLFYAVFEPGDFVMMRKMMLTIKQRAEARAAKAAAQAAETA